VTALIAKGRTFLRTEERFMHRHCCKQASLRVEEIPRSCRFFLGCVRRFQLRARLGPPWRQRDTHSLARRSTSHHRLFQAFPRVNRTLLTFRNPIPCASSSTSEPPASSPWQPWRFSVPAASSEGRCSLWGSASAAPLSWAHFPTDSADLDILGFRYALPI